MERLTRKFLILFTPLVVTATPGPNSNLLVSESLIPTFFACPVMFQNSAPNHGNFHYATSDLAASCTQNQSDSRTVGTSKKIHVKFRRGTNIDGPLLLLPIELQKSVASITSLFSLSDQNLDKVGAARLKLWFVITLKPETDMDVFLESLKRLDCVEVAEWAPRPVPPPCN